MEDECRVYTPVATRVVYDQVTRRATTVQGRDIYRGRCRLWEVPAGGKFALGEVEYTTSQTWLSLPFDAPVPQPDDMVQMIRSTDPSLNGRHLKILSVTRGGGLRGSRRMQVELADRKDAD